MILVRVKKRRNKIWFQIINYIDFFLTILYFLILAKNITFPWFQETRLDGIRHFQTQSRSSSLLSESSSQPEVHPFFKVIILYILYLLYLHTLLDRNSFFYCFTRTVLDVRGWQIELCDANISEKCLCYHYNNIALIKRISLFS